MQSRQVTKLSFDMAAYVILRDTEQKLDAELKRLQNVQEGSPGYVGYQDFKSQLNVQVSLEDYSVSNRGLRP